MPSLIESIASTASSTTPIMDNSLNTNDNFVASNGASTGIRLTAHEDNNAKNYYLDSTALRPHISHYHENGNGTSNGNTNGNANGEASVLNTDSDANATEKCLSEENANLNANGTSNGNGKPCSNYSKRNQNCIDLDFYDYLQKKSKYSTFTLWNLTASCHSPNLQFSNIRNGVSVDAYASDCNKMKVLYELKRKRKPEYLSLDKVNELGVNFVNGATTSAASNGTCATNGHYASAHIQNKLSFNENQLDLAIFKCLNKNLIDALFVNAKLEKKQTPSSIIAAKTPTNTDTKTAIGENEHEKANELVTHEKSTLNFSNSETNKNICNDDDNNLLLNVNTDKLNSQSDYNKKKKKSSDDHDSDDTDELATIKELLNELVDKVEMRKIEYIQLGMPILITNSELEERSSSLFGDEKYIQEANELTDLISNGGRNSRLASNSDELEALFSCKSEEVFDAAETSNANLRASFDDAIVVDDERLIDVICDELQRSLPLSQLEEICIEQQKDGEEEKREGVEDRQMHHQNEIEIENAKLNKEETNTLDKHLDCINHDSSNPERRNSKAEVENENCNCKIDDDGDGGEMRKDKYLADLNEKHDDNNNDDNNKNNEEKSNKSEDYRELENEKRMNENSTRDEIEATIRNLKVEDKVKEEEKEGDKQKQEHEQEINCASEKIATQISNGCLMQVYHSSAQQNSTNQDLQSIEEKRREDKSEEQRNCVNSSNNNNNQAPISPIAANSISNHKSSDTAANNENTEAMQTCREDTEQLQQEHKLVQQDQKIVAANCYETGLPNATSQTPANNNQCSQKHAQQNEEFSRASDSLELNNEEKISKNSEAEELKSCSNNNNSNSFNCIYNNINHYINTTTNNHNNHNSDKRNYAENLQQQQASLKKIEKSQTPPTPSEATTTQHSVDLKDLKEVLDESIAAIEADFDKMSSKAAHSNTTKANSLKNATKTNTNSQKLHNQSNTPNDTKKQPTEVIPLSDGNNKRKYIFSSTEIAYVEDCDSENESPVGKNDAQFSLFSDGTENSWKRRDITKTSPRNRGSSTGGTPFRYTFEQKPLDGDHCVKEALKRFDAFCKAKCSSAVKTESPVVAVASVEKPPQAPKEEIKPTDYTSFIKRRQNRINHLNMGVGAEASQKVLQRSESCDNYPQARAELVRQKSEKPELSPLKAPLANRASSSFAKRFLESMSRADEPYEEFDEHVEDCGEPKVAEGCQLTIDEVEKKKVEADKRPLVESLETKQEPVEEIKPDEKVENKIDNEKSNSKPVGELTLSENADEVTKPVDKPIEQIVEKPFEKIDTNKEAESSPREKAAEVAKPIEKPTTETKAENSQKDPLEAAADKQTPVEETPKDVNASTEAPKATEPRPKSPQSPTKFKTLEQPTSPKRSLVEERKLLKSPTKDPLRNSTEKATFKPDYHHLSTKEIIKFLNSNTQQQTSPKKESPSPPKTPKSPPETPKDDKKSFDSPPKRPTDLNTRSRVSSLASNSSNDSSSSNKSKNVNIIKLELINSKLNNASHRSSNASSENGVFSDNSENSPAPLSPSSWRKKLRSIQPKSSSFDQRSPTSSEKAFSKEDNTQPKSPTKTVRSKSVSDSTDKNTEIKPRFIPIEIKKSTRSLTSEPSERKSSTSSNGSALAFDTEKSEAPKSTDNAPYLESSHSEVSKSSSGDNFTIETREYNMDGDTERRLRDIYYSRQDLDPSPQQNRRALSEEPDPLVEKACNNFMYKFMEFKRQRQMSNPSALAPTYAPETSAYLRPATTYEPSYSSATSISAAEPYKHSLSTPNCDYSSYRRSIYPEEPCATSSTDPERPYVSSIRKRRTLLSEDSGVGSSRLYGATGSASAYEMSAPYSRLLHSSSSVSAAPYSSYSTPFGENRFGGAYPTSSSTSSAFGARPLSMVNEEFNSRLNFNNGDYFSNYATKPSNESEYDSGSFVLSPSTDSVVAPKSKNPPKTSDVKSAVLSNRSKSVGLKAAKNDQPPKSTVTKPLGTTATATSSVFNRLAQNASKLKSLQQTVSSHSTSQVVGGIASEIPDTKSGRKVAQQTSSEDESARNATGTGTTRPSYLRLKSNESSAKNSPKKEAPAKKSAPKGSTEIPVKVETVIPITIETKDARRPSNGSNKSSNSPMSPPGTLKKKPTQITTNYAFGSSLNSSRTSSMKNLSNIARNGGVTPSGETVYARLSPEKQAFKSSASDLLNFGLSLPSGAFEDVDIGIDAETCMNTKLNQQQSRNGLNVFERLYRGSTPTGSTSNTSASVGPPQQIINTLLFPPQSDSNGNGAKQTLKKNMSISTASLSSSTGSNNTNSTQSGAPVGTGKMLGEENRSTSKTSLNTAAKTGVGANSVFDRLASARGSLKKSSVNLNNDSGFSVGSKAYTNLSSASANSFSSVNRPEFINNNSSDDNQEVSSSVSSRKSTGPTASAFNRQNSVRSNTKI